MKLLVVESPTKAKHISHILGREYTVMASVGHIRDLPVTGEEAYVRPPDFPLNYVVSPGKADVVNKLREAAKKADEIYLATDPDREGEAISWHLSQVMELRDPKRITYQEVTEGAIRKALSQPRTLNLNLIAAQETRRGLDRMIGWEVSGVLSRTIRTKASAGRVQTPALRLIVERERLIRNFSAVDYFSVQAFFPGNWHADWDSGEDHFPDRDFAERLAKAVPGLSFKVKKATRTTKKQPPQPPFTTSNLQKAGSRALKTGIEEIMKIAQSLFEQGLITYHRTDSPNLSREGEAMIRKEAGKRAIPLSEKPRRWKASGGAQEAHEAIRPTNPARETAGSTEMEKKLYHLIWSRAMASQGADALFEVTSATFETNEFEGGKRVFKATGSRLTSPGWKAVYGIEDEEPSPDKEKGDQGTTNPVPALTAGEELTADKGLAIARQTKPPGRYTQSSLVDALEKNGIGRPSTYASIMKVLFSRGYVEEIRKSLQPTTIGESVVDALTGRFLFSEIDYTKEVEQSLDEISEGKLTQQAVLQKVWDDLTTNLKNMGSGGRVDGPQAPCPLCGQRVVRLVSKKGFPFWKCQDPSCGRLFTDQSNQPGSPFAERQPPNHEGAPCPVCEKATGRFLTAKGAIYFRCDEGHGTWWSQGGKIGKEWPREWGAAAASPAQENRP